MIKNLSCNAGDVGSISGGGTKILYMAEQLSPRNSNWCVHKN